MSEKNTESLVRGMVEAYGKREVEKTLSFLAEDAVWVAPEGTFKGKEEIKRYMTWGAQRTPSIKFRDAGIGFMVKGNKVVYEHVEEGVTSGEKWEIPVMCVYEFSGEKIQQHRAFYDRLSIAKQAAKGPVGKRVVSSVVKGWEKGLH
jgi:ketosteroid isomerase-like protein